jgi:transposase
VKLPHPRLASGAPCPLCPKGKVYELALPSMVVRIVGGAPLQATVYELTRLRCNLCGQVFTAPAPEEVNQGKYDDSAAAMIAVLKYGCGMPFYRLEKLQANLGIPVPASTQWEILDEAENPSSSLKRWFAGCRRHILHNDDTTARILALIEQQDRNPAQGFSPRGSCRSKTINKSQYL